MNAHHCHEHCCKNSSDAKWREKPERRIRRTPPPSSLRLAAAANATPGRKPTSGRRGALQIWLENEVNRHLPEIFATKTQAVLASPGKRETFNK